VRTLQKLTAAPIQIRVYLPASPWSLQVTRGRTTARVKASREKEKERKA